MAKVPLTVDDLKRVFIRAQDADGNWVSVDLASASDAQFDAWVKSLMKVRGEDSPWSLAERCALVDELWQHNGLGLLSPEAMAALAAKEERVS